MAARTLIVGDVHGCSQELDALIAAAGFAEGDDLVFVGDLVAKGPDSKGVVDRARRLNAVAVRGNHDQHCLKWWNARVRGEPAPKMRAEHQEVVDVLTEDDWEWLAALPLWHRLPEHNAIVVHAGVVPGVPLEEQQPFDLMNMRSILPSGETSKFYDDGTPWTKLWKGPEVIVFGHDAIRGLQQHPHAVGLDTGCVYGGELTGLLLPEGETVSVPAVKAWAEVE